MTEEQLEKIKFFETSIENENDVSKKIRLWHDYRNYFSQIEPQLSLEIAERGYEYAVTVSETEAMSMLFSKSNSLTRLEKYEEAFKLLTNCLSFFVEKNDRSMIMRVLGGLSNIYIFLNMYPHAKYIINLILTNYITENDKEFAFVCKANLMLLYVNEQGILPFTIEEIDEMLKSYEEKKLNNTLAYLSINQMKARVLYNEKKYDLALEQIYWTIEQSEALNAQNILIDAYYDLGRICKQKNENEKMETSFLKAIQISHNLHSIIYLEDIYQILHKYYSNNKMFKKALEALENFNYYSKQLDEKRNVIVQKSEVLSSFSSLNWDKEILSSLFNNSNMDVKMSFFIKDIKNNIHVIRIQDIVYAQKNVDILKVQLAIGKPIYSHMNFKDFVENIQTYEFFDKLFFETNMRSQIINLFWMNKMDLPNKIIYLRALENEYEIKVSKRQYALIKKHLLKFNL